MLGVSMPPFAKLVSKATPSRASTTVTVTPAAAKCHAADSPANPAPTTNTFMKAQANPLLCTALDLDQHNHHTSHIIIVLIIICPIGSYHDYFFLFIKTWRISPAC